MTWHDLCRICGRDHCENHCPHATDEARVLDTVRAGGDEENAT